MYLEYPSHSPACQAERHSGQVVATPEPEGRRKQDRPATESREAGVELAQSASLLPESLLKVASAPSWGVFLDRFPWDWFVTLTFRGTVGEWGAERKFRRLVRTMRHDCGHRVEWFRVTEWHKFRNVPHYHALFTDCKQLRRMRYVDWWWGQGFGTARIFPYDKRLGAGQYLGKYLMKQDSDLSASRGLKRFAAGMPEGSQGLSQMPYQSLQRPVGQHDRLLSDLTAI